MRLRVAHFIQRYPPAVGGSEAYMARLSRFVAASGDAVTVFTTTALALEAFWSGRGRCLEAGESVQDGVVVRRHSLWGFPGRRFLLKALSLLPVRAWQCVTLPCNPLAWGLWRDAGRPDRPFDVVHAAAFPYAFPIVCARRLARRLGVPFLVTPFLHLGDPDDPRDPIRRAYTTPALLSLLASADRVFVQTSGERAELLRQGLAREKIILQGLGVDPAECTGGDRAGVRQAWQVAPGEIVIGHLANLSYEKGSVDLLKAVALLAQRGLPVRLVLAGPEMRNFQRFCGAGSKAAPVMRLGILSETQKKDFFAGLDVFALPSRSDSFGLVLLEAWANGVANVAYRAGGIADVIRHEQDGLLARYGDVAGLADALECLVRDKILRRRFGAAGRQRLPEFHWHDKLALVRQVYAELARKCQGVSRSRSPVISVSRPAEP